MKNENTTQRVSADSFARHLQERLNREMREQQSEVKTREALERMKKLLEKKS